MSGMFLVVLVVAASIAATQALPAETVAEMQEFREKCIALSGSEEGYQQILESIEPAKACILNRLDVQQFQRDAAKLENGPRKPFFNKYCPKVNRSMSCLDDTIGGLAKCVGDDVDQVKVILKKIAYNILDIVCKNNGQLLFDLQKPDYTECIEQLKEDGAEECKFSEATIEMSFSEYDEEQCRELDDNLECLKQKVDECNAPKLAYIFEAIFNPIIEAKDCKQNKIEFFR